MQHVESLLSVMQETVALVNSLTEQRLSTFFAPYDPLFLMSYTVLNF